MELQGRLDELEREGLGVAALSYDPAPVLSDFSARRGITFPLLSDPGSATIKRYGLLNTTVPETNREIYGVPFPGTFMLDPHGIVTSRFFEQAYQERSTVNSIMARLGHGVRDEAISVSSPQLSVVSYVTDRVVAPGTHFSVVLDVRPAPGMHVYAPGVTGYKPIALSIEPQQFLAAGSVQYPKSEVYHFRPLNERVSVYQRPFRIVQNLVVDASPNAQTALKDVTSLTITGVLTYQACDATICFTPQSVPLRWRVNLRQLDRERARPSPDHARSREYNTALGVECTHCHAEKDFADQSKPVFDFARRMARMVSGLNDGPLQGLGPISCWTCHRGHTAPRRLDRADWESIATAHAADFAGGRPNLGLAMAVYSASLGVDCSHCHAEGDWKDASKPAHQMVRRMGRIFEVIPTYFDKNVRTPVTQCFMCHQGSVHVEKSKPQG